MYCISKGEWLWVVVHVCMFPVLVQREKIVELGLRMIEDRLHFHTSPHCVEINFMDHKV